MPDTTTFYVAVYSASGLGTSGTSGVRYKTPTAALDNAATNAPATPPVVTSPPVFTSVGAISADLGGTVTDLGNPAATLQGTVWNETGGPVTEDNQDEAITLNVPFSQSRSGMKSSDQIFFSSYAKEGTNYTYSSVVNRVIGLSDDDDIDATLRRLIKEAPDEESRKRLQEVIDQSDDDGRRKLAEAYTEFPEHKEGISGARGG